MAHANANTHRSIFTYTGVYLHMGKFTPGSDQMQILFLQIHMCKFTITQSKIYLRVFLFQVNILLLDYKFSHFLFITDYMTVAETVDIVAK